MGVFKRLVEKLDDVADKKIADTVERAGVPPKKEPSPKPAPKKPDNAKLVRGLGERIGFAGIAVFTVGAALLGAAGCGDEGGPTTAPAPTCDEPAVWCQR